MNQSSHPDHQPPAAEREQQIRDARYTERSLAAADIAINDLLAEVDRLRKNNNWLDRHYAGQIEQSVQLRDELDVAQNQFNELSREMSAVNARLSAVLDLCDREERNAMRWANPIPVPEWVAPVQRAALGDDKRSAQGGAR